MATIIGDLTHSGDRTDETLELLKSGKARPYRAKWHDYVIWTFSSKDNASHPAFLIGAYKTDEHGDIEDTSAGPVLSATEKNGNRVLISIEIDPSRSYAVIEGLGEQDSILLFDHDHPPGLKVAEGQLARLLADGECLGCDLKGVDLGGFDLTNANLSGVDLSGADLSKTNLTNTDLRNADLRQADLTFAVFTEADLSSADFRGATLVAVNFSGADLTGADLRDADLEAAYFKGANLTGLDLTGATLSSEFLEPYMAFCGTIFPEGNVVDRDC